jgi:hypothetical protein
LSGVLAQIIAKAAATISNIPPAVSSLKKSEISWEMDVEVDCSLIILLGFNTIIEIRYKLSTTDGIFHLVWGRSLALGWQINKSRVPASPYTCLFV